MAELTLPSWTGATGAAAAATAADRPDCMIPVAAAVVTPAPRIKRRRENLIFLAPILIPP